MNDVHYYDLRATISKSADFSNDSRVGFWLTTEQWDKLTPKNLVSMWFDDNKGQMNRVDGVDGEQS